MIQIPVSVRVWTEKKEKRKKKHYASSGGSRKRTSSDRIFVFDTETTNDRFQNLKFGSFRVYEHEKLLGEGLFQADDLKETEKERLETYAAEHGLDPPYSLREFHAIFHKEVYKLESLCVGFNLPFDLSRLSTQAAKSGKARNEGAFTFTFSGNPYHAKVRIRAINNKSSFIEFASPSKKDRFSYFKGRFLDLRTLAYALTAKSHSLESACELFGVGHGKQATKEHGKITCDYIAYNRRDVEATWELYLKLAEEFTRHPIKLDITKALSPASIGKAYLKTMSVRSLTEKQPKFSRGIKGAAMASYSGGRAEVHIRKKIVPVTYLDVRSSHPSVFVLQKLWLLVVADKIKIEEATQEVRDFLSGLKPDDLFHLDTWARVPALVQILPDSDILPVRAEYAKDIPPQIGLNYLSWDKPMWYTLADLIASWLLTGKIPKIVKAFRSLPVGIQEGLVPVKLRGEVPVNPKEEDFFKKVIEERARNEKMKLESLAQFLKILANSTSYGIFAELNSNASKNFSIKVYDGFKMFSSVVNDFEKPGDFTNPILATLVTGAARLILAMMEHFLAQHGATHAFCDTDSMAVVGQNRRAAEALVEKFKTLTPYSLDEKRSLIKVEDENFALVNPLKEDVDRSKPEALYFYGISAKRYVLFNLHNGRPVIRKFSEHGLGHLVSPLSDTLREFENEVNEGQNSLVPVFKGRKWIREIWQYILEEELEFAVQEPDWFRKPAIGRLTISQPSLWKPLRQSQKPYGEQVKPFNFMLVAFPLAGFNFDYESNQPIRPVAPYELDSKKWLRLPWVDLYSGKPLHLDFSANPSYLEGVIPVKTYGDIVAEYKTHPEVKAADSEGNPCDRNTVGILGRLHVTPSFIRPIGKESKMADIVQMLGNADDVQQEYKMEWQAILSNVQKALEQISQKRFAQIAKLSRMGLHNILHGARPTKKTIQRIRRAFDLLNAETQG